MKQCILFVAAYTRFEISKDWILTEADDGWQIGEISIADPLRNGEAGDSEAGNEIRLKQRERISRSPTKDWKQILKPKNPFCFERHSFKMPKRIVGKESLLELDLHLLQCAPRRRQDYLVDYLHHFYLHMIFIVVVIVVAITIITMITISSLHYSWDLSKWTNEYLPLLEGHGIYRVTRKEMDTRQQKGKNQTKMRNESNSLVVIWWEY